MLHVVASYLAERRDGVHFDVSVKLCASSGYVTLCWLDFDLRKINVKLKIKRKSAFGLMGY